MTDQNTNELWGDLRALSHAPLEENLTNDYGDSVSPDAERAVEVVELLQKFPAPEREDAREYAQKGLQRVGVDSELFRTAVRFASYNPVKRPQLGQFFASARDGYLGQVYTSDYQGHVEAYYLDDGVLYKTSSSYGSCSYCCSFQKAVRTSRGTQVLESFRLQGMCKVVHPNPHPDDVKHLVELAHEEFVRRYGEWFGAYSSYVDSSWDFSLDYDALVPDDEVEEEDDPSEWEDYEDNWRVR